MCIFPFLYLYLYLYLAVRFERNYKLPDQLLIQWPGMSVH